MIFVSSAYFMNIVPGWDGFTAEKARLKIVGPIADPWGTPEVMGLVGEVSPEYSTYCFRFISRLRVHLIMKGLIFALDRTLLVISNGILTKAFDMSRYIIAHLTFL